MAYEVRCVAMKLQRLIPRGINNRCHLIFPFVLPALSTALSLLSSRRNDLFTALGCDVHGHTALAVHAVPVRGGGPPLAGLAGSRNESLCSSVSRASVIARGRLTFPVSTSAHWKGKLDGIGVKRLDCANRRTGPSVLYELLFGGTLLIEAVRKPPLYSALLHFKCRSTDLRYVWPRCSNLCPPGHIAKD